MENQERQSLHGEVIAANLNEPMSWEIFLRLSETSQKEYIYGLRKKFNVSVGQLAELFNVKKKDLVQRAELLGIDLSGARPTRDPEKAKAWEEFCARKPEPIKEPEPAAQPEETTDVCCGDCVACPEDVYAACRHKLRVSKPSDKPERKVVVQAFKLAYSGTLERALAELEVYADVLADQAVTVTVELEV